MKDKKGRDYDSIRSSIERQCILTYKPERFYPGYVLFTTYMSNIFYLMNMEGNVVHTWQVRTAKLGELLPNGHLVYGHMGHGLVEIDWYSKELWYYKCSQHHDFAVMSNGHVMILCGVRGEGFPQRLILEKKYNPNIRKEGPFGVCYFIEVDCKTNEIVWEWWADQHIEELERIGIKFPVTREDVFHTNTCEVLPDTELGRKDKRFKAGNVLFNHKNLDVIGVIDKESGKIVWAWGPGIVDKPHMPTLIPDVHPITKEPLTGGGHILIFDNGPNRGFSRVIELDPLTERIVWEYSPDGFWGSGGGGASRMPNGNTLICEGGIRGIKGGRFFEVTYEGEIVWEYLTLYFDMIGGHEVYRCVKYPIQYGENIINTYNNKL